uniref:DNA ligase (ATP) n=1 Tax=Caulobacter sp. (strain K31) TaxID=366602 RepID=B0T572_CAUSK
MRAFAHLLDRLSLTASRNAKLTLIKDFLRETPDPERGWVLAALTGALSFSAAKPAFIRKAVEARMDAQLFAWSYDYVGDLAETVALVWPAKPGANREPDLSEVVEALRTASRTEVQRLIEGWLDALDADGRWALLKLMTGGLRVGVSARLAKQACADFGGVEIGAVEEVWHAMTPPYGDLFAWLEGRSEQPSPDAPGRFRPVMLAQAIDEVVDFAKLDPADYAAEWKWDGIRVQAVSERGERRLYTRTGDDISATFPDVLEALTFEGALDGELLVMRDGRVASFGDLQQRLNRKTVDAKQLANFPIGIRAYDLLLDGEADLRGLPFVERRQRLEAFIAQIPTGGAASPRIDLSPIQPFATWEALAALRAEPPAGDPTIAEGLMLKRWDSVYEPGRPKGPWFKWKRDPRLIDAVLMYAQRGHGKRSSFYSDYTFGVWREDETGTRHLTPVGKAYFGFTDEELKQIDKFVRDHTVERFGPVRSVRADWDFGLVFEVAFEGLQRSTRHKSGVAMRFPRINRIRWDKPSREADELNTLERMLD